MKKHTSDLTLDSIYDFVDDAMKEGQWEELDRFYFYLVHHTGEKPLDVLLAYATASRAGKSKIPSRVDFINMCKKFYPDPKLWKGLD